MPSPILARADALMQRRRQSAEGDDVPVLTDAIDLAETDDDIPVLLDIEAIEPLLPADDVAPSAYPAPLPADEFPAPGFASMTESEPVATQPLAAIAPTTADLREFSREDIAREIARRVELRLATELPHLIAATVRDYLAEQEAQAGDPTAD